jgi:guanylate kinase
MQSKHTSAGSLFMVTAPSGAGKSSMVNALLAQEPNIKLSVSFTTRPPRPGEENGREYHFITKEEFLERKDKDEFLEYAEVHGNFYGTSKTLIAHEIDSGTDVLLEIDWQGAQQVKKRFQNAVGIFILPPSIKALEERLKKRGQDDSEVITRRILAAGGEIAHAPEFEYVIINQDFAHALSELRSIVTASRCRFNQQSVRQSALFAQLGIHAQQPF